VQYKPKYHTDRETLERECEVEFIRDSGPGGQHRNKRETGVRMNHLPSGTQVTAVERRSQSRNLDEAYSRMTEQLEKLNHVPKKRKSTKVSKSNKEERLKEKKEKARKKNLRGKPDPSNW
jgi:ribosome-associated protein